MTQASGTGPRSCALKLSSCGPSTEGQLVFGKMLAEELVRIGMSDVEVDWNGYVMATLPANSDHVVPVVGFVAHMDTSPDCSGRNVHPRLIDCFDGNDILLNAERNVVLSTKRFPEIFLDKIRNIFEEDVE